MTAEALIAAVRLMAAEKVARDAREYARFQGLHYLVEQYEAGAFEDADHFVWCCAELTAYETPPDQPC